MLISLVQRISLARFIRIFLIYCSGDTPVISVNILRRYVLEIFISSAMRSTESCEFEIFCLIYSIANMILSFFDFGVPSFALSAFKTDNILYNIEIIRRSDPGFFCSRTAAASLKRERYFS